MKKTLLKNSAFLIAYFFLLLLAGRFLLLHSKGQAHLILNQYRSEPCDYFFSFITYLGDGYAALFLVIFLCFFKYRNAILLAVATLVASLITQFLKHTLFSDQVRPKKYFEGIAQLKLIPWVENYSYNSFPSGHATTAFAAFFCLALLIENNALKLLMLACALIISFSRVYLSQHFLNDIVAGSFIGVTTSLFIYHYIFQSEIIKNATWMEGSILNNK
jgi:membrane-associated phospholipid phosphatase